MIDCICIFFPLRWNIITSPAEIILYADNKRGRQSRSSGSSSHSYDSPPYRSISHAYFFRLREDVSGSSSGLRQWEGVGHLSSRISYEPHEVRWKTCCFAAIIAINGHDDEARVALITIPKRGQFETVRFTGWILTLKRICGQKLHAQLVFMHNQTNHIRPRLELRMRRTAYSFVQSFLRVLASWTWTFSVASKKRSDYASYAYAFLWWYGWN